MNKLPRAKQSKLGWTIDPEVLMAVNNEVHQAGWDSCLEMVEVAILAAERMMLENNPHSEEADDGE